MKIKTTNLKNIESACIAASVKVPCGIKSEFGGLSGNYHNVRLRPVNTKLAGIKFGYKGRRVAALSFDSFGAFFAELYRIDADAVCITAQTRYNSAADFHNQTNSKYHE